MRRYAILAIGAFDYIYSKTGNMLIRYRPDEVVAVIDPEQAGKTANQVLGWGGTQRLPRIVGKGNATELIIGGHMIDAHEALRIGLANKVFPQGQLLDETIKFAKLILGNGPDCVAESLRCINDSAGHSLIEGLNLEVEAFSELFGTEETNEGLNAFVEKRKPDFRN